MYPSQKPAAYFSSSSAIFLLTASLLLLISLFLPASIKAQTPVTGAIEGTVTNSKDSSPVADATVQIINEDTKVPRATQTDKNGYFIGPQLPPGRYRVVVMKKGFTMKESLQLVDVESTRKTLPPISLDPEVVPPITTAVVSPTPTETPQPGVTPSPSPSTSPAQAGGTTAQTTAGEIDIRSEINTVDGRRGGSFQNTEVSTLPLGGTTLIRSFDELALLLPGVAPPPQTQGSVAGPGVGAGVGSAGQFAVNGLRSRANNFTVDGSDNNDEDIGVRRQGFMALVPQPIESIQAFRVTTLLAPAQYGRNFGAQVDAVSKSGTNATHGTIYGFFNSSQLNARNPFDTTNGNGVSQLRSGNQPVVLVPNRFRTDAFGNLLLNPTGQLIPIGATPPINIVNQSGGKDSFTLGQGGIVIGGPLIPEDPARPGRSMFYFFSAEGQVLNATQEQSFAVPTVAQRGLSRSGASGLTFTPFADINGVLPVGSSNFFFPTGESGDALFSYFPFPNNPGGIYGANTFTQTLPASGQGRIFSGKVNSNFRIHDKQQSFTARYNFTQDWRDIPATGGAIFSTLRPRVRTQNFSTFLNSELSAPGSTRPIFNELRLSYGRTRLNFQYVPDQTGFMRPSGITFNNPEDAQFLLNAQVLENFTLPNSATVPVTPNTGPVFYVPSGTTEDFFGPVGQVSIAGFSPIGVDVFNFPQRRVNNTYQLADTLTIQKNRQRYAFGIDIRRTDLNSDLPRNSRPLITVNGAPRLTATPIVDRNGNVTGFTNFGLNGFISAGDLAATGATSGFFQTLSTGASSSISLRYYQYNFFGQDEWHVRPNLSISFGLRYEYNTPPHELHQSIENTFNSASLSLVPGLRNFIAGRTEIFDPDRNNFAPRIGLAYSFGKHRTSVIRGGYGIFYDQILGAVVSQSRNLVPTFLTANFAGGGFGGQFGLLSEPFSPAIFAQSGTLNRLDPTLSLSTAVTLIGLISGQGAGTFGVTLPTRTLKTPMAHHYSLTFEQQVSRNLVLSAAYVGTLGRNLLRFTTPNLGPNQFLLPLAIDALSFTPDIYGFALPPGTRITTNGTITGGRPFSGVGVVNQFETSARSRYDALQVQLRGRLSTFGRLFGTSQFQVSYTFSKSRDDASDVFDLAGSPSLPQDNFTFAGEYAPSNFDARHRISYDYITDLPHFKNHALQRLLGNVQIVGSGQFQTGQPFTVNSLFDVNLDGNLTDRLNSTNGIVQTGNRSQPLQLTGNPITLLAPIGQDGSVPRNSFRAGNVWTTDMALVKTIPFSESTKLIFRMEVFNLFNRANYGIPVRFLEAPGFGQATNTVTPARRIQFALKLIF